MKPKLLIPISMALFLTTAVAWSQTTFFSDNFSNGSTTNKISTPGGTPTASSTSYDFASSKLVLPQLAANFLLCRLSTNTSSGYWEAQALFSTNAIGLNAAGDYLDVAITFTNSQNTLFTGSGSPVWIGLFNSESSFGVQTNWPVPFGALANGGLTTTTGSSFATGNCANWLGYAANVYTGAGSKILIRPVQNGSGTASSDQELLGAGVSGGTFANPGATNLITSATQTFTVGTNAAYVVDLRITLDPAGSGNLIISNVLYTGSTVVMTNSITTSNIIANAFDGLAFGAFNHNLTVNPQMDVSSIIITGQSSPPAPPRITSQPAPVTVTTNGYGQFAVGAIGDNLTYRWYRGGAPVSNGGDISGALSPTLVVYPAQQSDIFSGANGYYCIVTSAGGSTNSTTNSLTLVPFTNLTWTASQNGNWDIDTTPNWVDPNSAPAVFTGGDSVNFSDANNPLNKAVTLVGNVAPSNMIVTTSSEFSFGGSGSIVGAGAVTLDGNGSAGVGEVVLSVNNSYTGGTTVQNGIYVQLENYAGFGDGPVNLNNPTGDIEVVPTGSASSGIAGQVNVQDNGTILVDGEGSFALVFLGNLAGTSGKTLTISPTPVTNPDTNQIRIRAYGGATTDNANIALTDANLLFASYAGTQIYNGVISGPGGFMEKGNTTIFNNQNTYTGGTFPATGAIGLGVNSTGSADAPTSGPIGTAPILLAPDSTTTTTGSGFIFANSNSITIGNSIQYVSGTNNLTLEVGGSTNLTLAGTFTLYGNDHSVMTNFPTRTLTVTNTGLTILTGQIKDGGSNYNFNLTGSGVTLFNATEAWGGTTTNSGGVMLVNGQIGGGAVVIQTNATLGGIGTITGPVTIQSGGTITAGSQTVAHSQGIGTLHLSSSLTFLAGSTNFVQVNTSLGTPNSVIAVAGTVTFNGTLYAQNVGPALSIGNSFHVVTAGIYGGTVTTVAGSPGPGLAWSFNSANGQLSVIQGISPFTVKPYILGMSLSGTNLTLTGSNAQANSIYYLLTTTNLQLPISQWTSVVTNVSSGSTPTGTSPFTFTFTNAVNPKDPNQFFLLSNTNL
jgi:autotransporter-associated beta strand protein